MRLKNLYGLHRLAMLGLALLVLSVAVFTLTAALAHVRFQEGAAAAAPPQFGTSREAGSIEEPWRVEDGLWSVDQAGYAAGQEGGSLVADSPSEALRLSFRVSTGTPPAIPDVFLKERGAGVGYSLSATSDGRLNLARADGGPGHIVATSAMPPSTDDTNLAFNIELDGARLQVWLNGRLVIDYIDPDPISDGRVRILTHDGTHLSSLSLTPLTH